MNLPVGVRDNPPNSPSPAWRGRCAQGQPPQPHQAQAERTANEVNVVSKEIVGKCGLNVYIVSISEFNMWVYVHVCACGLCV